MTAVEGTARRKRPRLDAAVAEYALLIAAALGLLVLWEPVKAPFNLDWGVLHFPVGAIVIVSLAYHFSVRARLCAIKSAKDESSDGNT